MATITWRPAASSMRNLSIGWSGLAIAAGAVTVARSSGTERDAVLVVVVLAALAASLLSRFSGSRRLRDALEDADRPTLKNWPPTADVARSQADAARADAIRVFVISLAFGTVIGTIPLLGGVVTATAVAGAVGGWAGVRDVKRFEAAKEVAVFMPSRRDVRRSQRKLLFGVARVGTKASTS